MFIELLFNDFIRFIGSDYTPLSVEEVTEASIACCVKQEIHGDYAINTYISMDLDTAIAFATRYVHEQFHSYDEYVQASLEDFLNLQNGLFIVNVSNTSNTELTFPRFSFQDAPCISRFCIRLERLIFIWNVFPLKNKIGFSLK